MMGSEVEGMTAVDDNHLDFKKILTPSSTILISKAGCYGLEGWTIRWVKTMLEGWTQRVAVHELCSAWRQVPSGAPRGPAQGPLLPTIFSNDPAQAQSACSLRLRNEVPIREGKQLTRLGAGLHPILRTHNHCTLSTSPGFAAANPAVPARDAPCPLLPVTHR